MWRASVTGVLVLAALAAALTAPADGASKVRYCGLVGRFDGRLYDVRETQGAVPCSRVRQVVTAFFRTDSLRPALGWVCFRGHGNVPWAASCARGRHVVVRVYAPT